MPFRLTNTFVTFQKLINNILYDIINKYIITYLDNILMFTNEKFNQHKKHIK